MDDIVEWVSYIEEKAAAIYRKAARFFADDPPFAQFLTSLSDQELQHSNMIKAAFSGHDLVKKEEIATTIDEETRQIVTSALDGVLQKLDAGGLSAEEMAAVIVDTEYSEWNGIFLYAMNVLKGNSSEYTSARIEIETHLKTIESYLSTFSYGQQVLKKIHCIPSLTKLRVLVVENDPALAFLIKSILARQAEVETAANGQEGLACLRRGCFDVIVVDVEMPIMNGIDMYQEVVRQESNIKERFLFLTASHKPEFHNFLSEQGLPVLRKPSPINRIRQAVINVSERKRIIG